ncbi:MAG: LytR C-terminal domain-containing protein [Patescibacteria group bacterium]
MAKVPHHSEIDFRKLLLVILIVSLVIGSIAGLFFFVRNYFELKSFKNERDVELMKNKLSSHLILPEEEPLIATVTDVEKLKQEQPFYRNAKNGDKVFIWNDKALIYRMDEDKIVDFGIIVNQNQAGENDQQITSTSVSILNGAGVANAANEAATELQQDNGLATLINNYQVGNATGESYETSVVVDLSGENSSLAAQIAEVIGAEVQPSLPEGESAGDSDIVVIIGSDYAGGTPSGAEDVQGASDTNPAAGNAGGNSGNPLVPVQGEDITAPREGGQE